MLSSVETRAVAYPGHLIGAIRPSRALRQAQDDIQRSFHYVTQPIISDLSFRTNKLGFARCVRRNLSPHAMQIGPSIV
ncbi:hypothetical protein C8P68_103113 [Mucilaginibacter yixingensis]|uniref:Uncharacterized protein n=1 Tax=Mucilaginibacter yixingensis TaxID=1295612 RepID=A0A2T5JAR0_9SPHI|nr:hypothetical protein C8P68_103113 [Mucilaginibacter yixingensis]